MITISLKVDENMLNNIDSSLKINNYGTRTEFVREAIRDKLKELEKDQAIKKLEKFFGAAKTKVSDKRHEEIREEVAQEYLKKYGL